MKEYNEANDDISIRNLELAAGNGDFGKTHFPPCYATDIDGTKENIDFQCDALNTPFADNRFDNIIICNPWHFGFNNELSNEEAQDFIREMVRIITHGGKIIIIGNSNNKYCKPQKVTEQIAIFNATYGNEELYIEIEDITATSYPNATFYVTDGSRRTYPNKKITIYVSKS